MSNHYYEGRLSFRWSVESHGWQYKLSFRRWQDGLFTPCLTEASRSGYMPSDEFEDRNITRLGREAAHVLVHLEEDEQTGQFALWSPPGHHDPSMWDRPSEPAPGAAAPRGARGSS